MCGALLMHGHCAGALARGVIGRHSVWTHYAPCVQSVAALGLLVATTCV